jgi:hypothetical protein
MFTGTSPICLSKVILQSHPIGNFLKNAEGHNIDCPKVEGSTRHGISFSTRDDSRLWTPCVPSLFSHPLLPFRANRPAVLSESYFRKFEC